MACSSFLQPATLLIFFLLLIGNGLAEKTCEAEDGVCRQSDQRTCDLPEGLCAPGGGIFRGGGSAQAYKPNAPIKSDICHADSYNTTRYKVAGWPFTRSSQKSSPRLSIHVSILSCRSSSSSTTEDSTTSRTCCCQPIDEEKGGSDDVVVEVWQTRPDGSFSSLRNRNGVEEGDCRAVGRIGASSITTFTTVAPGSTGCLGGLGPSVEFWPYGSPFIHFLVTAPGHTPTLVDVPIMFNKNNYEQKSFFGPDWRGPAWVKEKTSYSLYEITSWKGDSVRREIDINLNLYLTAEEGGESSEDERTKPTFCSSILYGLPSSFFLEPISVCAPSLLDFFPL